MAEFARVRILSADSSLGQVHVEVLSGVVRVGDVLQYLPIRMAGLPPEPQTARIQAVVSGESSVPEVRFDQECVIQIDGFGSRTPQAGVATCCPAAPFALPLDAEPPIALCFQVDDDGAV